MYSAILVAILMRGDVLIEARLRIETMDRCDQVAAQVKQKRPDLVSVDCYVLE